MIPVPAALAAHLQQEVTTLATLWKVVLTDNTVLGFTDHDVDIDYDGLTYQAQTGFLRSNAQGASTMAVDNMETGGMLTSPAITEDDLRAGRWDYASVRIMRINWADPSMGVLIVRVGRLGQVSILRSSYSAEIRGMMQAYSRTIGELTQPGCRAELFDSRCGVNINDSPGWEVTGTIENISDDGYTLYDSTRTEAGPPEGATITNITQANPGVVTVTDSSLLINGEAVMINGVVGPVELNTTTVIRNLAGNNFDLPIDTTNMDAYVSGGTVTPLGAEYGYFDFGLITFTSGLNSGLSMEIRNYVPGQWTLFLPMPYTVVIGDTYIMRPGCDKSFNTCKNRFNNVINFRGEPYLPGIDKIIQVGKQGLATSE